MNILYVVLSTSQTNSSAMIRNHALVEGFARNGHHVDLLVLKSETDVNNFNWDKNVSIHEISLGTIYQKYKKTNANNKNLKYFLRSVYYKFSIYDNTISNVLGFRSESIKTILEKKYDIVVSSSDPKTSHLYVGKLIENGLNYNKWIQYWGDPLASDITNKTIYPKYFLRRVERKIIKNANLIIYVSPFTLRLQKELFPNEKEKMEFLPIPYAEEMKFKIIKSERLTIGYYGDYFSKYRNIIPLIEVVENNKHFILNIVGAGDFIRKSNENIIVQERLDLNTLKNIENETDIYICLLNKTGTQIPGKIYKYASTNKPILIILDGEFKEEIRKYLENFNRFIICENNEDDIRNALIFIKNKGLDKYLPSKSFDAKEIAKEFVEKVKIK